MHRQVDAIQMGTHNICLYKEVVKNCAGCNLKTTELLDCVLIGAYRLNTVLTFKSNSVDPVQSVSEHFVFFSILGLTFLTS